ncbi:MAG: hypothetical protein HWN68_01850 [Desulfobacterales bacterium]|nr:hypothetical protein [Desulfobacterales bacterium]
MRTAKQYQNWFIFLLSLGFLLLHAGCGKKGPPVAPRAVIPPPVKDLKGEVVGDMVRLTWSIPQKDEAAFEGIAGFKLHRHKAHNSDATCPGCPIPFKPFLDIRLKDPAPAKVEADRIICYDEIEPEHRYAYKVVVYHKTGGMSEDSNIVDFVVKP